MQYLFSFANEHPIVFLLCVLFLSFWRPIQVYKQYGKPPDEYYLYDGDAKDDRILETHREFMKELRK